MVTRTATAVLLASSFFLTGCPKPERVAYETAVGAKAFLGSMQKAHPECAIASVTPTALCGNLARAVAAKDLLIDAGEIYCGGPSFDVDGGACDPPAKGTLGYQIARDKLQAAIRNYTQAEADLRKAVQ